MTAKSAYVRSNDHVRQAEIINQRISFSELGMPVYILKRLHSLIGEALALTEGHEAV